MIRQPIEGKPSNHLGELIHLAYLSIKVICDDLDVIIKACG